MTTRTKSNQLASRPLWECDGCGRLVFSDPLASDDSSGEEIACGPDCPECEYEMECVADPGSNAGSLMVFEGLAQHFYRDTGILRPGKDDARGRHTDAERWAAWNAWNEASVAQ